MKHKYIGQVYTFLLIILLVTVTAGCTPAEYTDGVRYKDFPDDVLPVYDDAIVFEFKNDDDEDFDLSAGTEDDVDDVAEFYQDYFDDEGITLTAEEEDKDEYTAEGVYEGYEFELKVKEPRGEWEEKLYKAVIEIELKIAEAAATPEPTAEPESTPTPEPTAAPTPTSAPDLSADVLGQWYLYDMTVDGQSQSISPESYYFYEDGTGISQVTSQTGDDTLGFSWDITETALIFYWDTGEQEARQYSADQSSLTTTYSYNGSQYILYFSREEPDIPVVEDFQGLGAWVVSEGDFEWHMAASFWPDGTGWFWWVDADGNDVDLDISWSYRNGVINFTDVDTGNYYTYYVYYDSSTMVLYDDTDSFTFARAAGDSMVGAYYKFSYVTLEGEVVNDASIGITFYEDGTGVSYQLNDAQEQSNILPITWYTTESGTLIIIENSNTKEFYYHLQLDWLSLRMLDEAGFPGEVWWFKYAGG